MENLELYRNMHNFIIELFTEKHTVFLKDKSSCACMQHKKSTDH